MTRQRRSRQTLCRQQRGAGRKAGRLYAGGREGAGKQADFMQAAESEHVGRQALYRATKR
jgi:hypothetical protein